MSSTDTPPGREPHAFLTPNKTFEPKRIPEGGFPPTYYYEDGTSEFVKGQIEETIEYIDSKLINNNDAFYILGLTISKNHPHINNIVRGFNANKLADLSDTEILVTSDLNRLKDSAHRIIRLKSIYRYIHSIRPLYEADIIDPGMDVSKKSIEDMIAFTIHLMPNIGFEKAQVHIEILSEWLREKHIEILEQWIDPRTGNSFINVYFSINDLKKFLNDTSLIFKVHERLKIFTNQSTHFNTKKERSTNDNMSDLYEFLPKICILDSGINDITPLTNLICQRITEPPLIDHNDFNDHGTSVACLAIYGDNITRPLSARPKCKIISRKILEHRIIEGIELRRNSDLVIAITNAIKQHEDCKVYNCSLNYESTDIGFRRITQLLHHKIQPSNKLFIFSAGNYDPDYIRRNISLGINYPNYLEYTPIHHPADALSILAVGACTKHESPGSLARANSPSPITRYGTNIRELEASPKPEIVEHGGNICITELDWNIDGIGVKIFSNNGLFKEGVGTSYAAPIISNYSSRIWENFSNINNCETIKTILLSICKPTINHPRYVNFGKPNEEELFTSELGTLRLIFEGQLSLIGYLEGMPIIPCDEIYVYIPYFIEYIHLYIVHSDNYLYPLYPELNTYIEIKTEKSGRGSNVKPTLGDDKSKSHVKHIMFHYKRNVKGEWFFKLIPHSINIPTNHKPNITIRYGGVLKLIAKNRRTDILKNVQEGMDRVKRTQITLNNIPM